MDIAPTFFVSKSNWYSRQTSNPYIQKHYINSTGDFYGKRHKI
jgi:hypothetical protein